MIRKWSNNGRIWRWVLLVAIAYFIVRGPWRAIHDSGDFLTVFSAARCWAHGMNPYEPADLVLSARSAGADASAAQFHSTPSVYPPPALLLLSPLALLPWAAAKAIWLFCLLGSSFGAVVALARMAKAWTAPVWSFFLAFAPLHSGISKGQPSVLVCALITFSIAASEPWIAGVLLGIALCIKPQLALGFLFLAAGLHHWRKLFAACATAFVTGGVALLCTKSGSLTTLASNLSVASSSSGIDSGSALNPFRYQLINVDTIIPQALYSTLAVTTICAIIVLVSMIALTIAVDARTAVAVVASATALVGYHRFYDAQILWLGIPIVLTAVRGRAALLLRACYSVFLIPGQTMAAAWSGARTDGPWAFLRLPHETLACMLLWLLFIGISIQRQDPWTPLRARPATNSLCETAVV
jgi:alpha-1,2-mannosyltransferase